MSLHRVAVAIAGLLSARTGMPVGPVPLARTVGAPWVWGSPAARVVGADPEDLAAALAGEPLVAAATVRGDGWLLLRLAEQPLARHLERLAAGKDLPSGEGPAPSPGADVERFEAARRAGGASAPEAGVAGRRTLANPVVLVQLAHARAAGVLAASSESPPAEPVAPGLRELGDPLDAVLLTEVLEAPRAFAALPAHPDRLAAALLAVATAYLPW